MSNPPKIRLHCDHPLSTGTTIALESDPSHYALKVMRLSDGDAVALFNAADGEWWGTLSGCSKKQAYVMLQSQHRTPTPMPPLALAFAPVKSGRIDFLVQKATELGALALHPVQTRRTIVTRVNEHKLRANAVEASEQCERLDVPAIAPYQKLEKFLDGFAEKHPDTTLIFCDETGKGKPPQVLLPELKAAANADDAYLLLIGPEGGFAPEELTQLRAMPEAAPMTLGPRVLRADTAALAALTALQLWLGDWEGLPRFEE